MANTAAAPRQRAAMPNAHMSRGSWERFQSVSEILVFFGCAIVVVGLVLEDWILVAVSIGHIAVIAGVMIEGLADGGILLASRTLQAIQEKELTEMRHETARANERTEELRLELARYKEPRNLNLSQRVRLVAALKKIPKQSVVVFAVASAWEMRWTQELVAEVLKEAEWPVRPDPNHRMPANRSVSGMAVEVQPSADPAVRDSAVALTEAFSTEGLRAQIMMGSHMFQSDARIEIVVGDKPLS